LQGLPEACCAIAAAAFQFLIQNYSDYPTGLHGDPKKALKKARNDRSVMEKLTQIVYWLGAAA
jgi:hypothetical protein